jgi:hypothetical protein
MQWIRVGTPLSPPSHGAPATRCYRALSIGLSFGPPKGPLAPQALRSYRESCLYVAAALARPRAMPSIFLLGVAANDSRSLRPPPSSHLTASSVLRSDEPR